MQSSVGKGKNSKGTAAADPSVPSVGALFGGCQKANRSRPLVVLIEGVEQADIDCLRGIIKAFSMVRQGMWGLCIMVCQGM